MSTRQTLFSHAGRGRLRSAGAALRCAVEALEPRRLFDVGMVGAGTGLTGTYFDNADFTTSRGSRVDTTINFNWGTGIPFANVAADTFSVRWDGRVQAQHNEQYTFFVNGDNGYRLWVDNQLILNNLLNDAGPAETSGTIALRAGQTYQLRLEYVENTGGAQVQLSWQSRSTAKQIIPTTQLYSSAAFDDRGQAMAETWLGFNGTSANSLRTNGNFMASRLPSFRNTLYRLESASQNWGDSYGTKVRGFIVPDTTGSYRFAVSGRDDVQLYLATTPGTTTFASTRRIASLSAPTEVRVFSGQASQQSSTMVLQAGQRYYFEVFHKAGGGSSDHFSVAWQTPWAASTWTVIDGNFLVPVGLDTAAPPATVAAGQSYTNLFTNASTANPRILGTPDDWGRAVELAAAGGQFATWRQNIINAANTHLDDGPVVYVASTTQATLQDLESDLTALASAWRLTGNDAYAAKAVEKMLQALDWPRWDGGGNDQELGIGMGAVGIATAWDWMQPYLTANVSATDLQGMRDDVNRLILTPVLTNLRLANRWVNWQNNWTFVVAGGAITAGLAVAPAHTSVTSELIARAIPRFSSVIDRTMGVNAGTSDEGTGYNTYGGVYLVKALAAMTTTLGTDYGVSRTLGFSQWATNFQFGLHANTGDRMWMYSEGLWSNHLVPWNFYFASRFNSAKTAWHIRDNLHAESVDPLYLLWWDDRGTNPATESLRTDFGLVGDESRNGWTSEEIYTSRVGWGDHHWDDAAFFFKGGKFEGRHEVLDAGTWNYQSQGKTWFPVVYNSDYGLPGYGTWNPIPARPSLNRFDYYVNRAESKNTLVLNGSPAPDQVVGARSRVLRNLSNDNETTSVLDLTAAYANQGVSRLQRGFRFDKRTGVALIQDEIVPNAGTTISTLDWYANIHDWANPQITNGGRDVMLSDGSARLYMRIVTPGSTWQVIGARSLWTGTGSEYLNPPGMLNYDASYNRLNIRLTGINAATTLTVAVWGNWGTSANPPLPALNSATTAVVSWFPRAGYGLWAGDIDGVRAGSAADNVTVNSGWASSLVQSTGLQAAPFDSSLTGRVVPFSFTVPVASGESIRNARLFVSLRTNSATNSNADTLRLSTPTGGALPSYRLDSTTLGWATVDTTLNVRELNLAGLNYSNGTNLLTALAAGQRIDLAFVGNVQVDWAYLSYEKVNAAGNPVGDGGSGAGGLPGGAALTSPAAATSVVAIRPILIPFSQVAVDEERQASLGSPEELF